MRIAHLSSSDVGGGAARGSFTLHRELVRLGVDSQLLVGRQTVDDPTVHGDDGRFAEQMRRMRHRIDQYALKPYRSRDRSIFSVALGPSRIATRVRAIAPDIVHLHWVAESFVLPEHLPRFRKPIIWTLRDMWPLTGGCHYAGDCHRFMDRCGSCPHLGSARGHDLSRLTWQRKQRAWDSIDITPVGISEWVAEQARQSSLFAGRDIRVIDNAIDVALWHRAPVEEARRSFGLPTERKVLLFVALNLDEKRKGFDDFRDSCLALSRSRDDLHALVVGAGPRDGDRDVGIPATFTGVISDDAVLRLAYSAADVSVIPSHADAFGKTVAESLACGTPCVVYEDTGPASVVDHEETGFVASYGDASSLAAGVTWILSSRERWHSLSDRGRTASVERFSTTTQAKAYIELYAEILTNQAED